MHKFIVKLYKKRERERKRFQRNFQKILNDLIFEIRDDLFFSILRINLYYLKINFRVTCDS